MFRNYFYIARNVRELNEQFRGAKVLDIYSQEKDQLFLDLIESDEKKATIIISANPQRPYILVKRNHNKAKKNFINFCTQFLPANIDFLSISTTDRVVNIKLNQFDIFIIVRGPLTNIFFYFPDKSVIPFKKVNEEKTKETFDELLKMEYDLDGSTLKQSLSEFQSVEEIFSTVPQINRDIKSEFKIRSNDSNEIEILYELIDEILSGDISVILFKDNYSAKLFPSNWHYDKDVNHEIVTFTNFQKALSELIYLEYRFGNFSKVYNEIEKFITSRLEFLSNKINNLKGRLTAGSKENEYRKTAELLLSNIYKLNKEDELISIQDFESGNIIKIKNEKHLSPNKLVDKYFEKAGDEKINFEKSKEMLEKTIEEYDELHLILESLKKAEHLKELLEIKKRLKISDSKNKKKDMEEGIKYRRFLIDGKYHVYVGKDSASNDKLTLRFAKQNDYWFHARGLPGSHVVLRVENSKEVVPKNILKKAASIAAFYSKGKTAKLIPVSYTFRKFVHKKKGMEPGKVLLTKENVLLVKPEIPKNCEEDYE
jgi:predicted ribosome quality control (RQC) complex YloA/Tae2 family protein